MAQIGLLGEVQVLQDGRVLQLGGLRQRCVLAVLLLNAGRTVARSQLVAWAWPHDPPDTAPDLVTNYISQLRKALRPTGERVRLLARRPGFTADLDPTLIDSFRFADLVRRARVDREAREDEAAAARLREALRLWRGPALAGLDTAYLRQRAEDLRCEREAAAAILAQIALDAGQPQEAVLVLRELLAENPGSETLATAQVLALTAAGDGATAAELAERTERTLHARGHTPGPALRQAHSDALSGRVRQGPRGAPAPRHQLPAATRAFTGRERELAQLLDLAADTQGETRPGVISICAIDGMAGIGKTALAIHAAHRVGDRFPDGQIFLDLHGYTEGLAPLDPADALAAILQSQGIAPKQIPSDLQARAALYRDRLAGTKTLIVLDNASCEQQVRPLLPGEGRCLVLVTSRRRLKGLDDGPSLTLDVLSVPDALALFRTVAGPGRVPANDPLLEQLVARCGRLPLAVRIAAAMLRHRPAWSVRDLAAVFDGDDQSRLDGFSDGERSLTKVFELSLAALEPEHRHLFCRLGLVPGPSLDAYVAAALTGADVTAAQASLQVLGDHSLLLEPEAGRYRLHDLLRDYARTRVLEESTAARSRALDGLLDYYQHTAQQADWHLNRLAFTYAPLVQRPPRGAPATSCYRQAADWMSAELANLAASIETAARGADPARAVALAAAVQAYLRTHGPWGLAASLHSTAVTAADRAHDDRGRASALFGLGVVQIFAGDYAGALGTLDRALRSHLRAAGGDVATSQHQLISRDDPLDDLARFHRAVADLAVEANILTFVSAGRWMAAGTAEAAEAMRRAAECFRQAARLYSRLGTVAQLIEALCGPGGAEACDSEIVQALSHHRTVGRLRCKVIAYIYDGGAAWLAADYPGSAEGFGTARDLHRRLMAVHHPATPPTPRLAPHPGRHGALGPALDIFGRISDEVGLGAASAYMSGMRLVTGASTAAVAAVETAVTLYQQIDSVLGYASSLTYFGEVLRMSGDHPRAAQALEEAIGLYRSIEQRGGEAEALCRYAAIFIHTEPERAGLLYGDALRIARQIASSIDEAEALEGLGEVRLRQSRRIDGIGYLQRALTIYQRLGLPKARELEARITTSPNRGAGPVPAS